MARKPHTGRYEVTGPGCEGRSAENLGAAMSLSLTLACAANEDGTWYVRDTDGTILACSTREDKNVETRVTREGAKTHYASRSVAA